MYFGRTARICAALVPLVGAGLVGCNPAQKATTPYNEVAQFDSTTSADLQRDFLDALDVARLYGSKGETSRILERPKMTSLDTTEHSLRSIVKGLLGGS